MPTLRMSFGPGPSSRRADQDRRADRVGRLVDPGRRRRRCRISGSMSLEFSGHTTRSGWACLAGVHIGGQLQRGADVVVEHGPALGVELQPQPRHVALDDRDLGRRRRPRRTRPGPAAVPRSGRAASSTGTAAGQATRGVAGGLAPGADRGEPGASASRPPTAATPNVTSGAPPSAASRSSGESAWLNASRPHGKPPNGVRSRSASCSTQSTPVTSGQLQRHRTSTGLTRADKPPSRPK